MEDLSLPLLCPHQHGLSYLNLHFGNDEKVYIVSLSAFSTLSAFHFTLGRNTWE